MGEKSPIVPILAGAGGAVVASIAAEKLGLNPQVAAWGTAAIGAATALGTKGMVRQVATGVGAAGACLGAISLFASAKAEAAKKDHAKQQQTKRQAEGDGGVVTRGELNDALEKAVQKAVDAQDKKHCDLLTALRTEIKSVVTDSQKPPQPTKVGLAGPPWTWQQRAASGEDEYTRNAYEGFDERNAPVGEDEYARNAYGDDERNAYGEDEYARNAYGDEYERNAYVAYGDEERNAPVPVDEYIRDGYAEDERNAYGDEYPAAA